MTTLNLRVATLNIGGGEKTFDEFTNDTEQSRQKALALLVRQLDADVLCLQEVTQYVDADGATHSMTDIIDQAGNYQHAFYGKILAMETDMQVKKDIMVTGIFRDWLNWSKGNALLARRPFARLGDPAHDGLPRHIPLFRPQAYEGNRDTDPRYVLLARLKEAPFPFIATVHLTTLVGERPPDVISHKRKAAQQMRSEQITRFLDLVRHYILELDEPIILAGDFNATAEEPGIKQLLAAGFVRLEPENDGPTHPDLVHAVDHIFFYPRQRLAEYTCRIESSQLSRRATDHLPVVADLQIN